MNVPIVGIIGRRDKVVSKIERVANVVLDDYVNSLDNENLSYVGIIANKSYDIINEQVLSMCDGFLMTGGVEVKSCHIAIIKYAIEHKIPFLGICIGSQALGLSSLEGAKLINLDELGLNHSTDISTVEDLSKISHTVKLKNDSILYNLFGEEISVNSYHHYALPMVNSPLEIVGTSSDGVIEAIEHKDKNIFAVGVQWHPESLDTMKPLFSEFAKRVRDYNKGRSK